MRPISFTDEDRRSLAHDRFHHPDPRVQRKIEVLWLKSHGLGHDEIATYADVSRRTVQRYLDEYREGGRSLVLHGLPGGTVNRPSLLLRPGGWENWPAVEGVDPAQARARAARKSRRSGFTAMGTSTLESSGRSVMLSLKKVTLSKPMPWRSSSAPARMIFPSP